MPNNIFEIPQQNHLYLYDKFKNRIAPDAVPKNMRPLPFYFFGSGSSGNSVYLWRLHTLIDLGFPYNHYTALDQNFFLDVDYLILTHEHTDHLDMSTLFKILEMFPNVKIICSKRLYTVITKPDPQENKVAKRITGNFKQRINELTTKYRNRFTLIDADTKSKVLTTRHNTEFWFIPHFVTHGDIINMGIELNNSKYNIHMLYASDLDHLFNTTGADIFNGLGLPVNYQSAVDPKSPDFVPQKDAIKLIPLNNPFNLMFLEANYDANVLDPILAAEPNNIRALGNKRHISEQEAWQYITLSLSDDGIFVPLHASTTFGTLVQNLD